MGIRGWVSVSIILAVFAAWLHIAFVGEERLPLGIADGSYANDCCGTIQLQNGRLFTKQGHEVGYVVERDKGGAYVLPAAFVGIQDGKEVQVDSGYPLTLRLDAAPNPTTIELNDTGRGMGYVFKRQGPSVR